MKKILTILATGVVSLVGLKAFKHHHGGFQGKSCCGGKKKMILKYLDWKLRLTDAQNEKISVIIDDVMASHGSKKETKKAILSQFSELFLSESFVSESIQKQAIEQMATPCITEAGAVLEQIHAILSPEQRREVVRLIEKHHRCCGHRGTC